MYLGLKREEIEEGPRSKKQKTAIDGVSHESPFFSQADMCKVQGDKAGRRREGDLQQPEA